MLSACTRGGLPSSPTPSRLFLFIKECPIPTSCRVHTVSFRRGRLRDSRPRHSSLPGQQLSSLKPHAEGYVHVFLCLCMHRHTCVGHRCSPARGSHRSGGQETAAAPGAWVAVSGDAGARHGLRLCECTDSGTGTVPHRASGVQRQLWRPESGAQDGGPACAAGTLSLQTSARGEACKSFFCESMGP